MSLTALLATFAASLTVKGVELGTKSLIQYFEDSPIEKAIDAAVRVERKYERDIRRALSTWAETRSFAHLLQRAESGERDLTDEEVVESFIEDSGFHLGHRRISEKIAFKVLPVFFKSLIQYQLRDESRLDVLDARNESRFQRSGEQRYEIHEDVRRIRQGVSELPEDIIQILENLYAGSGVQPGQITSERDLAIRTVEGYNISGVVGRFSVVESIEERLQTDSAIIIYGSKGIGKTIISKQIALKSKKEWILLDLSGKNEKEIKEMIVDLHNTEYNHYIIDSLNFEGSTEVYASALDSLMQRVNVEGGLLVTSQGKLPYPVAQRTDPALYDHFRVPPMNKDEVVELVRAQDCPDGQASAWGQVIFLKTAGHPQLAHAHSRNAARRGWPEVNLSEIQETPEDLNEVQRQARKNMAQQLPDNAHELISRLSLIAGSFSREQALRLADRPEAIDRPGEALDQLIGPWVERPVEGRYSVSPLLAGLGSQYFSKERQIEVNRAIAHSLLTDTIDYHDIDQILLHGTIGNAPQVLFWIYNLFHKTDGKELTHILSSLNFFPTLCIGPDAQALISDHPLLSLPLRKIQFQAALSQKNADLVKSVRNAWLRELEGAKWDRIDFNVIEESKEEMRLMFRHLVIGGALREVWRLDAWDVIPISFLIEEASLVVSHLQEVRGSKGAYDLNLPSEIISVGHRLDPIREVIGLWCRNKDDLDKLISACEKELSEDSRADLKDAISTDVTWTLGLVNRAWSGETHKEEPQWGDSLSVLKKIGEVGESENLRVLRIASIYGQAVVHMEYNDDRQKAEKVIREAKEAWAGEEEILTSYSANIHLLDDEYPEALDIYESVLDRWGERAIGQKLFTYRDALECVFRLRDWNKASKFASQAVKLSLADGGKEAPLAFVPGFLADQAYALFKKDRIGGTISVLSQALRHLDNLPETEKQYGRTLRRRIAQLMGWIGYQLGDEAWSSADEPRPALCSTLSKDSPSEMNGEPPSVTALWGLLANIEIRTDVTQGLVDTFEDIAAESQDLEIIFPLRRLRLIRAVHSVSPDLPKRSKEFFEATGVVGRGDISTISEESEDMDDLLDELGNSFILMPMTSALAYADPAQLRDAPVEAWKGSVNRADIPDGGSISRWFELVETGKNLLGDNRRSAPVLSSVLRDETTNDYHRLVAAVFLREGSADPQVRKVARGFCERSLKSDPFWID